MSDNHINIYHIVTDVSTHCTYDACPMTHPSINGNFNTAGIHDINLCRMSKGIFFISNICNHQDTHILKSAVNNDTPFSLVHDFNWPRKYHKSISAWRMWRKVLRTLCDESKSNLRAPLDQWTLDENKYIASWKWFLSRDLHTLHYREN